MFCMAIKNQKTVMIVLFAVIAVLALLVVYAFAVRPAISGYATKVYNDGVQYGVQNAVVNIMQQAASCSPSGVPLTFQNQTLNLVALECYKGTQQAAQNQGNSS